MTVPGMLFLRQLPKLEQPKIKSPSGSEVDGGAEEEDDEDDEEEEEEEKKELKNEKTHLIPAKVIIQSAEQIDTLYPRYEGFTVAKHLDFYLLGAVIFFGSGSGLLFINTLGS